MKFLTSVLNDKKIAVYRFSISCLILKLSGSKVVKIKGINGKQVDKNQSELLKFVTSYCLHVNNANIKITYSSFIILRNQLKPKRYKVK